MQFYQNVGDAMGGYRAAMSEAIVQAIRTLLETKHLYQALTVDEDGAREKFLPRVEQRMKAHCLQSGAFVPSPSVVPWLLSSDMMTIIGQMNNSGTPKPHLVFRPPHVKMFCRACNRLEPFNLVSAHEAIEPTDSYQTPTMKIEQVFTFTYLCQACKKFPEVVMMRRVGGKISLVGKTPMEHVAVPKHIPKEIATYYSGSVVAYQSGQTLAALFLLRTACEQWVRCWAFPADRADTAIDKYMASLPTEFSAAFPSIRLVYEKLSEDIHGATGSVELYAKMIADIDLHFHARSIYPGVKAPPGEAGR